MGGARQNGRSEQHTRRKRKPAIVRGKTTLLPVLEQRTFYASFITNAAFFALPRPPHRPTAFRTRVCHLFGPQSAPAQRETRPNCTVQRLPIRPLHRRLATSPFTTFILRKRLLTNSSLPHCVHIILRLDLGCHFLSPAALPPAMPTLELDRQAKPTATRRQ